MSGLLFDHLFYSNAHSTTIFRVERLEIVMYFKILNSLDVLDTIEILEIPVYVQLVFSLTCILDPHEKNPIIRIGESFIRFCVWIQHSCTSTVEFQSKLHESKKY